MANYEFAAYPIGQTWETDYNIPDRSHSQNKTALTNEDGFE
jgi:hypothetical protein